MPGRWGDIGRRCLRGGAEQGPRTVQIEIPVHSADDREGTRIHAELEIKMKQMGLDKGNLLYEPTVIYRGWDSSVAEVDVDEFLGDPEERFENFGELHLPGKLIFVLTVPKL